MLVSFAFALATKVYPILGPRKYANLNCARAMLGAFGMTASNYAIHLLELHDYTALFYSNPALTTLLAWLFLGEKATWLALAGMAVAMLGVPVLMQPPIMFGKS